MDIELSESQNEITLRDTIKQGMPKKKVGENNCFEVNLSQNLAVE